MITSRQIIRDVEEYFDLPPGDIVGYNRMRTVVIARKLALYLAKQYTPASSGDLGRAFGRESSTIRADLISFDKHSECNEECIKHFEKKYKKKNKLAQYDVYFNRGYLNV